MRVAESAPNWIETVGVNGSRWCVTESKAIARVESSRLMRTGAASWALAFSLVQRIDAIKIAHTNPEISQGTFAFS